MSDEAQADRRGIEIPEEVARAAAVPEDLDASAVGPYSVPDTSRRRQAGAVYLLAAAAVAGGLVAGALPAAMWWTTVAPLAAIALYHVAAGWHLAVRESEALVEANRAVPFPVGHASAQLGFAGPRAKPIWNVLVFSADEPPSERALVRIDALDRSLVDVYAEEVPPAER